MRAATHLTPPPASMMMNAKKHSSKRKSYIPSNRLRNNMEREALKYAKSPSMYGYIKLPIGRPSKMIDSQMIGPSPSTADTALTPATAAAASRASSVNVKCLVKPAVRTIYLMTRVGKMCG